MVSFGICLRDLFIEIGRLCNVLKWVVSPRVDEEAAATGGWWQGRGVGLNMTQ